MSKYVKFDFDVEAQWQEVSPAICAIPATQEGKNSKKSKNSQGTPPIARCPTAEGEEQSSTAPEKSNTQYSAEGAATFAIPATQEGNNSKNSKNSKGVPPRARYLRSEGEEPSSTTPETSNTQHRAERAAICALPAIPEEESSKNSKNSNAEPLTQYYPCVVCGKTERWDDAGIWRCVACWPTPLTEATRHAAAHDSLTQR
jgi:hypothetical protein